MKNSLLFILLLHQIFVFSQKKDSITAGSIDFGLGISKGFFIGNNFTNKSYRSEVGYTFDFSFNTGKNQYFGLFFSKNHYKTISTQYFGNVTGSSFIDFGFFGKKIIAINDNYSFVPQVSVGFTSLNHRIYNDHLNQKIFSSNGFSAGIHSSLKYKIDPHLSAEIFASYKHLFFPYMQASKILETQYKSTEMISIETRFSLNY